jgi:hypothetical protein
MSLFGSFSNNFFGGTPPIRPIKNVLPDGTLTDDEVCHYLIQGSNEEQKLTENWLCLVRFKKYYHYKMFTKKLFNLESEVTFAYDDAVKDTIDHIRKGVYRKEASLKVYFARIFDKHLVNIFRKKATNKSSDEKQALAHQNVAIEEGYQHISVDAIEPNAIEELLDLFEKKESSKSDWILHAILGWKDVDFVKAGKAKSEGSARAYLVECKKTFEQFLNDNGHAFKRQKDKKDKPKTPSDMETLVLVAFYAFRGLFDV